MARRTNRMREYARRRDMARMRDRARGRGYGYDGHYMYPEYDMRYSNSMYPQSDYARNGNRSQSNRQYNGDYGSYDMRGYDYYNGDMARGRRDYGDEETLSDEELMEWSKELLKEVEQKDKGYMTRENITQRAKDMGVKFKDYTEDEMVVTTLMMYTDYMDTLGTGNLDLYIRLAKDWLEDDDVEVMGGEKLAVYYDEIVCAD